MHNVDRYTSKYNTELDSFKEGKKKVLSRSDINEYSVLFHIIFHMYKRYGCPECEKHGCCCGVLPHKHPCLGNFICDGDTPWKTLTLDERERIRIVPKEEVSERDS